MKRELKWSIGLLILLFPLLAWVILSHPESKKGEVLIVKKLSDSSELKVDEIEDEPEPEAEMMPDGRYPQNYFGMPVDYDAFLSGTFAELRSNHFHGGLDIRTGGVEGKPIYAVADGYVSRIVVSVKGYGKAIYITHPNGYTSVYAHLKSFEKDIQFFVRKNQYAKKSLEVDLYPEKHLLKVNKGDCIAYSGNTGGSAGPHLHFEIRKTNSAEPINPLLFGLPITDNLSPEILKIVLYSLDSTYRLQNGSYPYQSFNSAKSTFPNRKINLSVPPGKYATGAHLKDFFRSYGENLGVNYSGVLLNNNPFFETKIEKIQFHHGRMINTHMDFCIHKSEDKKLHKFFRDNGNKLDYYTYDNRKGVLNLQHKDEVELLFFAGDLSGRRDSLRVVIKVDSAFQFKNQAPMTPTDNEAFCKTYEPGKTLHISHQDARLTLHPQSLYFPFHVCIREQSKKTGAYSSVFSFGETHVASHSAMDIAIKVDPKPDDKYLSKLLIVEKYKGAQFPVGGTFKSGFVEASVKDLGTYFVAIDTIPPSISVLSFYKNLGFSFKISDNLSGIKSYNASLNKEWILMEYEPKTGILEGKIMEALPSGKHNFRLIVKDERGNEKIYENQIIIP